MTFTRKGYGRIYVNNPNSVDNVRSIIEKLDSDEFTYMPEDLITTFDQYPQVVYTGKFDEIDLIKLTMRCYEAGIFIMCFNSGHNQYPEK